MRAGCSPSPFLRSCTCVQAIEEDSEGEGEALVDLLKRTSQDEGRDEPKPGAGGLRRKGPARCEGHQRGSE